MKNNIKIVIGNSIIETSNPDELPLSINFKLEDQEDFQKKSGSEALSVTIPATLYNQQQTNNLSSSSIEDLSLGQIFRNFQPAVIEANGNEFLVGKARYTEATHLDKPQSYQVDFYGNNADWVIDLKESTFWDVLKTKSFPFTKANIIDSWAFDGTSESLFYVFAPVRYGNEMDDNDTNMKPQYMKPSISKYWILYWAFQSIGYRIESDFFDTSYFRRQVMPWTWGAFLQSEGSRLNNLDFLARSIDYNVVSFKDDDFTGFVDVKATNDSSTPAFDNAGVYDYDSGSYEMNWTYLNQFQYGTLDATFKISIDVGYASASMNSDLEMKVYFYKNGTQINVQDVFNLNPPAVGRREFIGIVDLFTTATVNPGDIVTARVWVRSFTTALGNTQLSAYVSSFELEYLRVPLGGTIQFESYEEFKKYKVLDLLRGVTDEFNLLFSTDNSNKKVIIEPAHAYSLENDQSVKTGGFFNGDFLDWSEKQDLSKESRMRLYADSERELIFRYKEDANDGALKVLQDRYQTILGSGKYVFPERFKSGKREVTNRFFSPVVHFEKEEWKGLGRDLDKSPQIVCLIPENISNTSKAEAQNTFNPKSCYYKGMTRSVGWVFDGEEQSSYPYMFAVNYQQGGHNDPILSYSDEKIGSTMGKGLLRLFFLQRMAIMRNGQYYSTPMRLQNIDVASRLHREHKVINGQRYELVEIKGYRPLAMESVYCELRKHAPILQKDNDAVFPSQNVVMNTGTPGEFDTKYSALIALTSDIKQP